jgi:ribosomal protein S18 acetylase RimI-like enzyme
MCNLAVDRKYKRRGIAKSLVEQCEDQVLIWYQQDLNKNMQLQQRDDDDNGNSKTDKYDSSYTTIENSLSLKVRKTNHAAISLYERMGYDQIEEQTDPKAKDELVLMKKQPLG